MTKTSNETPVTTFRFDPELLNAIDAVAKRLSRPGNPMTRTGALRYLIVLGLQKDREEEAERRRISKEKRLNPEELEMLRK